MRRAGLLLLALAGMLPALAAAEALEVSPRPMPRPGNDGSPVILAPGALAQSPAPRRRPPAAFRPREVVQPAAQPVALPMLAMVSPPERPENLRRLSTVQAIGYVGNVPAGGIGRGGLCGDSRIKGNPIPAIPASMAGCGLPDGVEVTSVSGIPLSTPAKIDCPTAGALAHWVDFAVIPSFGKLGGGVARIETASSYNCRPQNNIPGAKISEHGRGRAVDISGFRLVNGTTVTVLDGWGQGQHGMILKTIRRAACSTFATVLGPGSDPYHSDHFHLDTARRPTSYCR